MFATGFVYPRHAARTHHQGAERSAAGPRNKVLVHSVATKVSVPAREVLPE